MELEQGLKQIDIAPLVNILFLLVIFLMLTSVFVLPPGIKVNLPKALTSDVIKRQNINILVTGENLTFLEGKQITPQELKEFLKEAGKRGQTLLIKADSRASLGRVVEIWDLARDLGIAQVSIATDQQ